MDRHVIPNAGLSEKVAVLSLSGKHTQRLLNEREATIAGITLPVDRPLAAVAGLDFAAFVDALTPWIEFAVDQQGLRPKDAKLVHEHAKAALQVLKVYRGTVWETYIQDGVTTTHSRSEIHDIEE